MLEEYIIDNKYKLLSEISSEPFGTYFCAQSLSSLSIETGESSELGDKSDKKQFLLLCLNLTASNLARQNLSKFQEKLSGTEISYNSQLWPVLEIIDDGQNISIVMPFLDGAPLATIISGFTKPLTLSKTLKFLMPLIKKLSHEHEVGRYHGFINFSTLWVTKDNNLKLLGLDVFNILFEKFEIKTPEFYQSKISSCLSEDNHGGKIVFSIASDYYSMLVITCSLLMGEIASTKTYSFGLISSLNKKARKLLTADYYRTVYQNNLTLEQWFNQIYSTAKWPVLENCLALLLVISLGSVFAYQYKAELKNTKLYHFYVKTRSYFNNPTKSTKSAIAIAGNNTQPKTQPELSNTETISHSISDLDIEDNLYNFTAHSDYGSVPESDKSEQPEPALVLAKTAITEITEIEGFKCQGAVCREPIVDLINGPKMIKVAALNDQAWVMQAPISNRDYYTYCFFVDDCKQKQNISDSQVLRCLFESECSPEANMWLDKAIDNLSIADLNQYTNWLNKVTKGGYQIIPDKYWSVLANKFKPDQHCLAIVGSPEDFVMANKPELVVLGSTTDNQAKLAVRAPAKFLTAEESYGEPQCQTMLITENISNNISGSIVRLIKKS